MEQRTIVHGMLLACCTGFQKFVNQLEPEEESTDITVGANVNDI